jgi:hypothetical protein
MLPVIVTSSGAWLRGAFPDGEREFPAAACAETIAANAKKIKINNTLRFNLNLTKESV